MGLNHTLPEGSRPAISYRVTFIIFQFVSITLSETQWAVNTRSEIHCIAFNQVDLGFIPISFLVHCSWFFRTVIFLFEASALSGPWQEVISTFGMPGLIGKFWKWHIAKVGHIITNDDGREESLALASATSLE